MSCRAIFQAASSDRAGYCRLKAEVHDKESFIECGCDLGCRAEMSPVEKSAPEVSPMDSTSRACHGSASRHCSVKIHAIRLYIKRAI